MLGNEAQGYFWWLKSQEVLPWYHWCKKMSCFFEGKKVTVRAPAPALARLTKPKHSSLLSNIKKGVGASKPKKDACASNRRSSCDLQEKPLRERVMHLLALRPYRRPELILRLQKDGLTAGDKNMLDSVLMEVFLFQFYTNITCKH